MGGFTAEDLLDGGKILKCLRGDDPIPFFVGPFTKIHERPGSAHFTAEGAVVYILDRTLPHRLPMKERIQKKDSFAFWRRGETGWSR
jgi:hypothetical protein